MKLTILAFIFCACAWSMPKRFEIWFISPDTAKKSAELLDKVPFFSSRLAQNSLQCQPMGDYCFDPQVGMYKPGTNPLASATTDYAEADKLEDYDYKRTGAKWNQEDYECDEKNMFDIFCGQTKAKKGQAKFEIWFDISSSMKQVDFAGFHKMCQRESFLRLLAVDCSFNGEMIIHGFNESKKQLGTMESVCLNHGLNDRDRIIRDIKASKANHLVVITDIYEADETLINFVESNAGGSVKGVEKPMYASDLKAQAAGLRKKCQ